MDIDTIIGDLNKIVRYREPQDLGEATIVASRLLELPRYYGQGDPVELLGNDIRSAVARLPPDLRRHAEGLLPIANPRASIGARQRQLQIERYSGPALTWHRMAVLGRVANELLTFYTHTPPSYQILDLDMNVWETFSTVPVGVGPTTHSRSVEFRWRLESLASDFRWFSFDFPTPPRLKLFHVGGASLDSAGLFLDKLPAAQSCAWECVLRDRGEAGMYLLRLPPIPPRVPIGIHVRLVFHKANKGSSRFEYVPTTPIKRMSLSMMGEKDPTCVELEHTNGPVMREFKARRATRRIEYAEGEWVGHEILDRFRVRYPKVGRCYRLGWTSG